VNGDVLLLAVKYIINYYVHHCSITDSYYTGDRTIPEVVCYSHNANADLKHLPNLQSMVC